MFSGSSDIHSYVSGREVASVKLPSISSREEDLQHEEDSALAPNHAESQNATYRPSPQQMPDLVTLSLLPKSQWQSLINLDIIKV